MRDLPSAEDAPSAQILACIAHIVYPFLLFFATTGIETGTKNERTSCFFLTWKSLAERNTKTSEGCLTMLMITVMVIIMMVTMMTLVFIIIVIIIIIIIRITWERSVERNSKTKVREVLVWMMSCRVTMFACRNSFNRLA